MLSSDGSSKYILGNKRDSYRRLIDNTPTLDARMNRKECFLTKREIIITVV